MTFLMTQSSQFKDLSEFLAKHSAKNDKDRSTSNITHTRIGHKDLNIYGGAYIIPRESLAAFYKLYYERIFEEKCKEYLT
jgi:hypothetical protein